MQSLLSIIELIFVACANLPEKAKGSHAAGPTSTSKLGDILDYFKIASSKSTDSALQGAAATVSNDVQASGSFGPSSNGGTKLGVGVHASKKKRKRVTDQSGGEMHALFPFPSLVFFLASRICWRTLV